MVNSAVGLAALAVRDHLPLKQGLRPHDLDTLGEFSAPLSETIFHYNKD